MPDRPDNQAPTGAGDARTPPVPVGEERHSTRQHLDTDALSAFIDDRLGGDLRLDAAGHISACPDCRNELAELQTTVSLLGGLPQYRPRRSFVLGPAYAHPVRTSRLARLLPMLPALRAATVAVLLLLVGVGVADVLTQIGEDSGDSSRPAAMSGDTSGETTMQPPVEDASVAREPAPNDVPPGDGTGGGGILPDPQFESAAGNASESVGSLGGDADQDAGADAPSMGAIPRDAASSSESNEDRESQSFSADEAPEPAGAADTEELGSGVSTMTEPAPTVAIVAAVSDESTGSSIGQADAAGATGERAASTADPGISNWRLIEILLSVALIALAALVIGLHRLSDRARRIGIIH